MSDHALEIRSLTTSRIRLQTVNAIWVWTRGVLYLLAGDDDTPEAIARYQQLCTAIATFNDSSEGNDPYGQHAFGAFELFGYHPDHDTRAPVPANIERCRRR